VFCTGNVLIDSNQHVLVSCYPHKVCLMDLELEVDSLVLLKKLKCKLLLEFLWGMEGDQNNTKMLLHELCMYVC
jgi:hypothetical protein